MISGVEVAVTENVGLGHYNPDPIKPDHSVEVAVTENVGLGQYLKPCADSDTVVEVAVTENVGLGLITFIHIGTAIAVLKWQ